MYAERCVKATVLFGAGHVMEVLSGMHVCGVHVVGV